MKVKTIIKSCNQCDRLYKFNSQKYFKEYCSYCSCEKQELEQRRLDLKMKDYMKLKYGGKVVEV